MSTMKPVNVPEAVTLYANALLHKHRNSLHGDLGYDVQVLDGKKFYKIVIVRNRNGTGQSVHSFVDRNTGALYKPASWAAPVKDERYNLLTQFSLVLAVMDEYGGYLYKEAAKKNQELMPVGT